MKKFTLLFAAALMANLLYCQNEDWPPDEEIIGTTWYDLQTWRTMQNRTFYYDDGTVGAVWNMGMDYPNFPDMGIGYNYFDGNNWGTYPGQSIVSGWAINPSYTAFGENGEICVSQGNDGLYISYRAEKGTCDWIESYFPGTGFKHPVVVTSGVNHSVIQLLYLVADDSFTPTNAQPSRGFIHYARSQDGGQSWDINTEIPGLGPDDYLGFTIGSYTWAEPKGDVIAFIAGDYLTDLILMKSIDGGDTWQKTIIWEHPYPMFEIFTFDSDTFYCNDGGISLALDSDGMAHAAFTLSRVYSSTAQDTTWFEKQIDGVVYWNEDRDTFSNNINALNPYGHPDSELIEDYNLIGWVQDINGNGQLEINCTTYPTPGMCTMPQIVLNEWNHIIVVWSAVTETYVNDTTNYRHIWSRGSLDGDYWGNFIDLNQDLIFVFSECVYPDLTPNFDSDEFYLTFQEDSQPGLGFPNPPYYTENNIRFMSVYTGWNPTTVIADFTADTTVIHEGDTVHFINLSSGYPPNMINYSWTFEGGIPQTSNDTNPEVVYLNEGIFDVELTANISTIAFNTKTEENYITVLPAVNIGNYKKADRNIIYPNPSYGKFILDLSSYGYQTVEYIVYNLLGTVVTEKSISVEKDLKQTINLSNRAEGIYFINIKTSNDSYTLKLVVQR